MSSLTDGQLDIKLKELQLSCKTSPLIENVNKCMNDIDSVVNEDVSVATEGLFSRAINALSYIALSNNFLKKIIDRNVNKITEKGNLEGIINKPGWGRSFNIRGRSVIPSTVVIEYVRNYSSKIKSNELHLALEECIGLIISLTNHISSSNEKLPYHVSEDLYGKINKLDEMITSDLSLSNSFTAHADADYSFEALRISEAQELGKLAIDLIDDESLSLLTKKYVNVTKGLESKIGHNSFISKKSADEDLKFDVKHLYEKIRRVMASVNTLLKHRSKLSHACSRYISASILKLKTEEKSLS